MLQFFDVTRDAPWFPQVKALYESAFPANERIPIKHLLDNKIKREFWTFFDKEEGENHAEVGKKIAATPMFCGFSNSISHGRHHEHRLFRSRSKTAQPRVRLENSAGHPQATPRHAHCRRYRSRRRFQGRRRTRTQEPPPRILHPQRL